MMMFTLGGTKLLLAVALKKAISKSLMGARNCVWPIDPLVSSNQFELVLKNSVQ
jgi:hypothetical protein